MWLLNYFIALQPKMNKIEECAVEYLFRTGDCKFAKVAVNSANTELRSIAQAVTKDKFPKKMKRMHTKCGKKDDE